jgi:hypothetical protein
MNRRCVLDRWSFYGVLNTDEEARRRPDPWDDDVYIDGYRAATFEVACRLAHLHRAGWSAFFVNLSDLSSGPADLAIYRKTRAEQGKCISVILASSHHCSTSDGLDTA